MVGTVSAVSQPIETEADGFESDNLFLNMGVNIETELDPDEIIRRLRQIERTVDANVCHRTASGAYCDRTIDLDLICLGQTVCNTPTATLPHPRMARRHFVLSPMAEVLPDWIHPQLHATAQQLLKNIIK